MAKKNSSVPQLPEAELDVLSCILQRQRVTAREIREALAEIRPLAHASVVTLLAHASVVTLLNRLEQKGLVQKQKGRVGKAFVYRASHKPAVVYRSLVQSMLDRVFAGNGLALVHSLFETQPPNPQELDELQTMLDTIREHRNAEESK
ncbi:MAG: BlaI/MecI/CopY family transcriptional regulator [Planctomycetota bacterium]